MKLICEGLDLADSITRVSKATSNKTTNPILEGIKIVAEENYLKLTATDLELTIEKTIKADVKIEGEIVVPGRFFSEYIKKLNNEQIELELDDKNILHIKYSDSYGKIQCLNAGEFPVIKKIDYNQFFEISQRDLKSLITKSVFAVATDDIRPILKGCKLEIDNKKITAAALDGYRLALVKKELINASNNFEAIISAKSLKEINNLLEDNDELTKVYVERNHLMVEIDNTVITSRLLEGNFINYRQIIPTNFTSVVVLNKDQLEDAVERASLLSKIDKNNLIKLIVKEKVMVLSSHSEIGDIKENITISLKGNDLEIAFNARYFAEALRTINDEFIKLNFTSTIAPCIINSNDTDEYTFLILPVRMV